MKPVRVLNNTYYVFEGNEQLVSLFENAKYASPFIAAPITLPNALILNNLGYDAPSPIRTHYRWPIRSGRTPRWYQVDTTNFMTLNKRGFCLNAMRTGKTYSTLAGADYLMDEKAVRKCIIAAPLSTLELVWADNIWYDFPHRKYSILHGSVAKRRDMFNQEADFYIINHDGIELLEKEIMAREDIDLVVFDEIAEYRHQGTNKWKAAKHIIKPHMWGWGLTGTPTQKEPTDCFGQVKLLKPENYSGSYTRLRETLMLQISPYKWIPRQGCEDITAQLMRPAIRFPRSVNTNMEPTLIERHADLSKEQREHVVKLINEAKTWIRNTQVTAVNAGVLLSKLVQTACGVVYGSDGSRAEIDFGPRLKVLEELIAENNEKVLVFVPFTGVLDALARELRKKWSVEVVDGRTSTGKRNQVFRAFQRDKDPHVIVCHPATMQHGLDLTAASLAIWYAPWTGSNTQADARIDGAAQKVKIDIARISSIPQERQMYKTETERISLQDIVLNLCEKGV